MKMTDKDYAAFIYHKVNGVDSKNINPYVAGVLEVINKLKVRESRALKYYYREGMTYKQVGEQFGINKDQARNLVLRALRKLEPLLKADNLNVDKVIENLNKQLEIKADTIKKLQIQIENLMQGKPISQEPRKEKIKIEEMGFSTRAYNVLIQAGLRTVEMLLAIDNPYEILKLRNCGIGTRLEIFTKMRKYGYTEWVDKMDYENRKTEIEKIGFSTRVYNVLVQAGLHKIESLLALNNLDEVMNLRNCGKVMRSEIITKMRKYSYSAWADKMETTTNKEY